MALLPAPVDLSKVVDKHNAEFVVGWNEAVVLDSEVKRNRKNTGDVHQPG